MVATCEARHAMPIGAEKRPNLPQKATVVRCLCPRRLCSPVLVLVVFHLQARIPCQCLLECERRAAPHHSLRYRL